MIRFIFWTASALTVLSCGTKEEKILPRVTNITESVYSSVTIQPDSLYKVYASINGILEQNLVEEGDSILKGTSLIQVVNTTPKINLENARLSLDLSQKKLQGNTAILVSLMDEINTAKLSLSNDSLNYFRQKNLWSQNIGSKIDFDTKKLNYELSKNNVTQLQDNYERTKDQLQTQLAQAKNNYSSSLVNSKDYTVRSKINGKVYALFKNPGEIVNTQEPLALVGSKSIFVIQMLVDEVDIVKINIGQKVVINLDAYNGEAFTAKVSKIYPKKDERNQTFVVEALFDTPPEVLYPGLSGEANILIAEKKEALIIPKEFLIDNNKVKTKDGILTIKVGLESMDKVEVLSGVTDKTWIYKPEQ